MLRTSERWLMSFIEYGKWTRDVTF